MLRLASAFLSISLSAAALALSPEEARSIAKDATTYGLPLVDGYRVLHAYAINKQSPEYKNSLNHLGSVGRVFTPEDTTIQTPNSDTPYSMVGFDLRREPLVFSIPPIDKDRYFSVQFIDAYTHNFDYAGSRTTGNSGGRFLLAGPSWNGETPPGITKVFRCETNLGIAIFRTQLLNPDDIENVRRIQAAYKVEPLSASLNLPAPPAPQEIAFPSPLSPQDQKSSLQFFSLLDFLLDNFCPVHPSEKELRARFASLGLGADGPFDPSKADPAIQQAMKDGMADSWLALNSLTADFSSGKITSASIFGSRDHLKNNYPYRFLAAVVGLWGNSAAEAIYPACRLDSAGQPLDGSKHHYTLRFAPGQSPPVHAFWSATMYQLPASLLYANPLNRYLINSPMLPNLKSDPDGGLTLHIQHTSPGPDRESNWLPSPSGPFWIALRLYWPKVDALNGSWKQPQLEAVN